MRQAYIFIFSFLFISLSASSVQSAKPVTKIDDVYRGAYVNLTGSVVRFLDEDEFVLQDDTGSIRVYIGWNNRMPVRPGEKVTVEGFVDFDLRLEVYAWTITKENGEVIELDRRE